MRDTPRRMRALVPVLVALLCTASFSACSGKSAASNRAEEQLAALQKKKEAEAKAKRDKENAPQALPTEVVKLDPPFDDTQAVVINPDGPCPEGLWALFAEVPGANADEKKANAAKKKELAEAAKAKKYLVKLRGAQQVMLSPYDAPAGKFNLDVAGTVDCTDSIGRIALAWTDAKAGDPGNSAAKADADFSQNVWTAAPVHFDLMIKSLTEAKEFNDKNRFGLSARVGFTLGKTEVDKKVRKVAKVKEEVKAAGETLSFGGGNEDWGAGRLIHVDMLGIRVATDREKKMLFEKKK